MYMNFAGLFLNAAAAIEQFVIFFIGIYRNVVLIV